MILLFTRKKSGFYCGERCAELKMQLESRGIEYVEIVNLHPEEEHYNVYSVALAEASWEGFDWNELPWLANVESETAKPGESRVGRHLEDVL